MRLALISDVHANLYALRAVLDAARSAGVDTIICAGDLVGYGPHPNECIETVAELELKCVVGNHDLMAIGKLPASQHERLPRETQQWTRATLRPDTHAFLATLPTRLVAGELVVAHGALDDPETYIVSRAQASAQLAQLADEHPVATTLVLGHTHRRWIYDDDGGTAPLPADGRVPLALARRYLLNPGSVGQSRQWELHPRARFMLLNLELRCVECHAVDYDVASCRAALRDRGLPQHSIHVPPGRAASAARRAIYRVLGHVRGSSS